LRSYEELFEEKLDLFAALLSQKPVTWEGKLRPPLKGQLVYPPVENGTLKTWIGVGGSPQSVVRAAHYDLPLMLAIIGGDPARFAPFVDLYHRAFREFGRPAQQIGVHSPGYVAETDEEHARSCGPTTRRCASYRQGTRLAADGPRRVRERGRARFTLCRLAETAARKIAKTAKALGSSRFQLKYSAGPLPHEKLMRSIELYGRKVVPMVRQMLG
jgi:alkanesulfonate monooxygenase SsuD/methylene tetrahydromethanopterin reductase-like flavin-dependent oxidoreductase (luciferase family)